jgi:hypothetical protein
MVIFMAISLSNTTMIPVVLLVVTCMIYANVTANVVLLWLTGLKSTFSDTFLLYSLEIMLIVVFVFVYT